jgi:hypothetical protein
MGDSRRYANGTSSIWCQGKYARPLSCRAADLESLYLKVLAKSTYRKMAENKMPRIVREEQVAKL